LDDEGARFKREDTRMEGRGWGWGYRKSAKKQKIQRPFISVGVYLFSFIRHYRYRKGQGVTWTNTSSFTWLLFSGLEYGLE
jgi:hypothetical protein